MKYKTREEWLQAATGEFRHWYRVHETPIPQHVRVSCGWPSKSATSARHRRIGECWSDTRSADQAHEIFISPTLSDRGDVLAVLAHELLHASVGCEHGHKAPFKRGMKAIGLEGPARATHAGPRLQPEINRIIGALGDYPHAALTPSTRERKQSTRLLKVECTGCGYVARVTRVWLERDGAPLCPCNHKPMVEVIK